MLSTLYLRLTLRLRSQTQMNSKVSMPPWLTYAPCKDIEVTKKISVFPLVRKEPSEVGEPIQRYPQ